jgi:hypothetical protein
MEELTVDKLAEVLKESNRPLLSQVLRILGPDRTSTVLIETLQCEAAGGMLRQTATQFHSVSMARSTMSRSPCRSWRPACTMCRARPVPVWRHAAPMVVTRSVPMTWLRPPHGGVAAVQREERRDRGFSSRNPTHLGTWHGRSAHGAEAVPTHRLHEWCRENLGTTRL